MFLFPKVHLRFRFVIIMNFKILLILLFKYKNLQKIIKKLLYGKSNYIFCINIKKKT
jgi:hypothetical protein